MAWYDLLNHFRNLRYLCTGTKNVAIAMKSIAVGAQKRSGITWFPELSDKSDYSLATIRTIILLFFHREEYKDASVLLHKEL